MKDANQIAAEAARREKTSPPEPFATGVARRPAVQGSLTIWRSLDAIEAGNRWLIQSLDVVVDFTRPGQIIAYDEAGDAQIFYPEPGWYVNFCPNREGE